MASFLARTFDFVDGQELGTTSFTDIADNTHEHNIARIAGAGFAQGTTPTTYSLDGGVRRHQMASFISRIVERFARTGDSLHRRKILFAQNIIAWQIRRAPWLLRRLGGHGVQPTKART